MPVKKKSRRAPRRNALKPKHRAANGQNSFRPSSSTLPESEPADQDPPSPRSRREDMREELREDLWIAETTSLRRQEDIVAWNPRTITPSDARLLELADIALGLRKPESFRRRKPAFLSANGSRATRS